MEPSWQMRLPLHVNGHRCLAPADAHTCTRQVSASRIPRGLPVPVRASAVVQVPADDAAAWKPAQG
eukprot:725158-Rhodomonas_salina.1